jgi:hypothetical protein
MRFEIHMQRLDALAAGFVCADFNQALTDSLPLPGGTDAR